MWYPTPLILAFCRQRQADLDYIASYSRTQNRIISYTEEPHLGRENELKKKRKRKTCFLIGGGSLHCRSLSSILSCSSAPHNSLNHCNTVIIVASYDGDEPTSPGMRKKASITMLLDICTVLRAKLKGGGQARGWWLGGECEELLELGNFWLAVTRTALVLCML